MTNAGIDKYAPPENPALPPSDMKLNLQRAALLVTDPQIDFLSPKGVTWELVGESVTEQHTVAEHRPLTGGSQASRYSGGHLATLLLPDRSRLALRGRA